MRNRFENRVAIITGGSRGIGLKIAEQFAKEGAKIAILDINEEELQRARKKFENKNYPVLAEKVDVSDSNAVNQVVENIYNHFGSIDILVNNAGIIRDNLLFKMSDKNWQQVLDVHLNGSFYMARAAQTYMVKQKYGRIINISSTSALGNRGQANYSTAKAGLQGLTKTLAIELGKFGITTNSVAPGFIETEMTKKTAARIGMPFDEFVEERIKTIPVNKSGKPEDIAHAVAFFADEQSSFINGQVLYVAGGPRT